jgi:hypothetical protein
MKKSLYWAAGVLVAGLTFAGAASAGSLPATTANGLTQDLSARCRTVVTHRWSHGRRIAVRRNVCTHRPRCHTVVKYRWHHGHRTAVRTRVC